MPDTKTASQWNQVTTDLQIQQKNLQNKVDGATEEAKLATNNFLAVNREKEELGKKLDEAGIPRSSSPEYQAVVEQLNSARDEKDKAYALRGQLLEEQDKNNYKIQFSQNQTSTALNAPPGTIANPTTSDNTAPANPEPGNNTDVAPYSEPVSPTVSQTASIDDPEVLRTEQGAGPAGGIVGGDRVVLPEDPVVRRTATVGANGGLTGGTRVDQEAAETVSTDDPAVERVAQTGANGGLTGGERVNSSASTTNDSEQPTQAGITDAQSSGNESRYEPFPIAKDYRVRISLSPNADYLYKDPACAAPHLLYPLQATDGVLFPYTPQINVTYSASYNAADIIHTNYKIYNYTSSSVETVQITGDFTAQDVGEANYVLAVMHFFKCVTKMFYGQDERRGVPPPLVYLSGHGEYGFDNHPMVITNYTLNYPTDVDYINAGPLYYERAQYNNYTPPSFAYNPTKTRLYSAKLQPGGVQAPPTFGIQSNERQVTRVPTKLQIQISALPIVTRDNISNTFSLTKYATGELLRGSKNARGGGIW